MRARGFTLTELSIALAVLGLLLAVALPAWSHVRGAAQARAAEGALLESLLRAGGRAAITGRRAVLCASRDGEGCSGSSDWSRGWIAFHDFDADRNRDAGEPLLMRVEELADDVRLRSTVGRARIVFQANGSNAGSNVTFTLCDGRGEAHATALVVNNQGRLRRAEPTPEAAALTCAR